MNAGRDKKTAMQAAKANANYSGSPRWVFFYNGAWWINKTPVEGGTKVEPDTKDGAK